MKKKSELIGWVGTIFILAAYALLSFGVLESNSLPYQLMNLLGASGIIIDTYFKKDKPPLVLNSVWALIAIFALVKILIK